MAMTWTLALLVVMAQPTTEQGLDGWSKAPSDLVCEATEHAGRRALRVAVPASAEPGFPNLNQDFEVDPGDRVRASADILPVGVSGGYGAYLSVSFHDATGQRISFEQSVAGQIEGEWNRVYTRAIAPLGTTHGRLALLLNGHGEAYFSALDFTRTAAEPQPPLEGHATLTLTGEKVGTEFVGFGFEDDGWFHDEVNARHGVGPEEYALREERIRALNPDWVRMFFWYRDWNPSMDGETFTWDNNAMRSKYAALALYEELGADVLLCGVEWGIENPFAHPERLANAWGALAEHLVKAKQFGCVNQWTLSNEPSMGFIRRGGTWEAYVETHRLVKESFQRLGLDIAIVGSDDTNHGLPWFLRCVEDDTYFALTDRFASHTYLRKDSRDMAALFFEERLEPLQGRKPFVVAEFGFHDSRTEGPLYNPVMEDEEYAAWTMRFVLEGLNAGADGFSIWCLQEMYYPFDTMMNYGLWNFSDRDSALRPVYHAWKLLLDRSAPGDAVSRVTSSHPGRVEGVQVGGGVFWVNDSGQTVDLRIDGGTAGAFVIEDVAPGRYGWWSLDHAE